MFAEAQTQVDLVSTSPPLAPTVPYPHPTPTLPTHRPTPAQPLPPPPNPSPVRASWTTRTSLNCFDHFSLSRCLIPWLNNRERILMIFSFPYARRSSGLSSLSSVLFGQTFGLTNLILCDSILCSVCECCFFSVVAVFVVVVCLCLCFFCVRACV